MTINSRLYNTIFLENSMGTNRIFVTECNANHLINNIIYKIESWGKLKTLDIYVENLEIILNKKFLLFLTEYKVPINIYTNNSIYLKRLLKNAKIKLYKNNKNNKNYISFKLNITKDDINNLTEYNITHILSYFCIKTKKNTNSNINTYNLLTIHCYNHEIETTLFEQLIFDIYNGEEVNTANKRNDSAIIQHIIPNEFGITRDEFEKHIDEFITSIKNNINKKCNKINHYYQLDIRKYSDIQYDNIKINLLHLFDILSNYNKTNYTKNSINIALNIGMIGLECILADNTYFSNTTYSIYSIMAFILNMIFPPIEIGKSVLSMIQTNSTKQYFMNLINNDLILIEIITQLSIDFLLLLSYNTSIRGLSVLGDIEENDKYILLSPIVNKASHNINANIVTMRLNKSVLNNKITEFQHGYVYIDNSSSVDNKKSKQIMLEQHIDSIKYMLYVETPLYFMPYIDRLLKNNFNLQKSSDKNNITSKAIDVIILSSSPYKWQEKFLKQQLNNSYNAVPIRYTINKSYNQSIEDYSSYDIALKSAAVQDIATSKIYFFTYINRYTAQNMSNLFNSIISHINKLKNMFNNKDNKNKIIKDKILSICTRIQKLNNMLDDLFNNNINFPLYYIGNFNANKKSSRYAIESAYNLIYNIVNFCNQCIDDLHNLNISLNNLENIIVNSQQCSINDFLFQYLYDDILYLLSIFSSIRRYFFSKDDFADMDEYNKIHKEMIESSLQYLLEDDPLISCEIKHIHKDIKQNTNLYKYKANSNINNRNSIFEACVYPYTIPLTYLRLEIYKLYYGVLNDDFDFLNCLLKNHSDDNKSNANNYTNIMGINVPFALEHFYIFDTDKIKSYTIQLPPNLIPHYYFFMQIGLKVHNNILCLTEFLNQETNFKYLLESFEILILYNIGLTTDMRPKFTQELIENLYYSILGIYLTTQCYNYVLSDKNFSNILFVDNKIDSDSIDDDKAINTLSILFFKELLILTSKLSKGYNGVNLQNEQSVVIKNIEKLYNDIYTNNLNSSTFNNKQNKSNNILSNYRSALDFSRISLDNTLYSKLIDKNSIMEDFIKETKYRILSGILLTSGIYHNSKECMTIYDVVENVIKQGYDISSPLTAFNTIKGYLYTIVKSKIDNFFKTIKKEDIKQYYRYIKYLYLKSDKIAPLANINNGDIIIPGKVQNNYMIFDNSYSLFGGSSLDMTSFIDTESIYASVLDGEISRNLFFSRIEELILPLSSHDELRSIVFGIIEKEDLYQCSAKGRKDKLKSNLNDKVRTMLEEKNIKNAIDEYSELLANYGIVELFRKNYKSIFNIIEDNNNNKTEQNNNIILTEEQRAQEYSVFAECLHNIARHNTRNIYIQDTGDVIEWKFIYKEDNSTDKEGEKKEDDNADKKEDKKVLCLMGSKKKVKHIAYLGSLALFPMENSSEISDDSFRIEIVENESIIQGG